MYLFIKDFFFIWPLYIPLFYVQFCWFIIFKHLAFVLAYSMSAIVLGGLYMKFVFSALTHGGLFPYVLMDFDYELIEDKNPTQQNISFSFSILWLAYSFLLD